LNNLHLNRFKSFKKKTLPVAWCKYSSLYILFFNSNSNNNNNKSNRSKNE
jgi:hypothetical protein